MYIYQQTANNIWSVGFFDPDGEFKIETSHSDPTSAAQRTAWLNGSHFIDAEEVPKPEKQAQAKKKAKK